MTIITKEEFDKLYDEKISKKEYDSIIEKIDDRFSEIMNSIRSREYGWYDYDNENGENCPGHFDLVKYKKEIFFTGNVEVSRPFESCFPTKWLWDEDFRREFIEGVSVWRGLCLRDVEEAKKKEQLEKEIKQKMKKQITAKLTKEELKFIKFK